jgi:ubiquinone/menaquinone biosynthesis C-methylase UbiE
MGSDWAKGHIETLNHPHRPLLAEKILSYAPLQSVLEIGCNAGPNLYLLAQKLPQAELHGIDINPKAIEVGKAWLKQAGISNVRLSIARADRLERFADKSVDLVFSDATLIYIGPDKICNVIKEMARIARKALIFNEWHQDNEKNGLYYDGHWVYDYKTLISDCLSSPRQPKVSKIPEDLWGGGGWGEFGAIIEVSL